MAFDYDPHNLPVDSAVIGLAASLAVGLLIGLERGWRERELPEGGRVAGLRTFALIGLFGGVCAQLRGAFGPWALAVGLIALALLAVVSYSAWVRSSGQLSATSTIAALLTYVLGALAASGAPVLAAAVAVVATVLLDLKSTLHRWLQRIEARELSAALQMLVLSVVILPLLPDQGYGPYEALNPYKLWWAVVLVSGLSLGGHFAMRASGPQRGLLWTGLLGGLASSTAATLTLARQVRQEPELREAANAGIQAACGVMFLRMTLIAASLAPALGRALALPFVIAGGVQLALALLQWRRVGGPWSPSTLAASQAPGSPEAAAPAEAGAPTFDLSVALGFAAFLGVMAVLGQAAHELFGRTGLFGLSLLSGLADVDAILITLARMSAPSGGAAAGLTLGAAGVAAVLAAASNLASKTGIAWVTGDAALGRQVAAGYALTLAAGLAGAGLAQLLGWLG